VDAVLAVGIPFLISLGLALRGSWWSLSMPAPLFMIGTLLYLTNDAVGTYGGTDEEYFWGLILMAVGFPWLLIALPITLVARSSRRGGGATAPRNTA